MYEKCPLAELTWVQWGTGARVRLGAAQVATAQCDSEIC